MEAIPDHISFLKKIRSYCASKERSPGEIKEKLATWGCPGEMLESLLDSLKKEDFLNEERFARDYVINKFRIHGWGRLKIAENLNHKGICSDIIRDAMKGIPEAEYISSMESQIRNGLQKKSLFLFLLSKGFEEELITEHLKKMKLTEIQ